MVFEQLVLTAITIIFLSSQELIICFVSNINQKTGGQQHEPRIHV